MLKKGTFLHVHPQPYLFPPSPPPPTPIPPTPHLASWTVDPFHSFDSRFVFFFGRFFTIEPKSKGILGRIYLYFWIFIYRCLEIDAIQKLVVLLFLNSFTHVFLKWTLPSLNSDWTIVLLSLTRDFDFEHMANIVDPDETVCVTRNLIWLYTVSKVNVWSAVLKELKNKPVQFYDTGTYCVLFILLSFQKTLLLTHVYHQTKSEYTN